MVKIINKKTSNSYSNQNKKSNHKKQPKNEEYDLKTMTIQ